MRIVALLALCLVAGAATAQQAPQAPRAKRPEPRPARQPEEAWAPKIAIEPFWLLDPLQALDFQLDELRLELEPFVFVEPALEALSFQLQDLQSPQAWEQPVVAALEMAREVWPPDIQIALPHAPMGPLPVPDLPEPARHTRAQDSPGDSLYRLARETLNRGEYRRAVELFQSFEQRYPSSRYVPTALYWQAFALYRVGVQQDLRRALEVLERQRERYPETAREEEVAVLYTRVAGALAARGDAAAAARLRAGAAQTPQACDREDLGVRAEALKALVQADPAGARAVLGRVLARRDDCSAPLRRQAVYLLAREGGNGITAELLGVARNDPDDDVRRDAISQIARLPGEDPARALQELFTSTQDEKTQRAILSALARHDSESARQFLRSVIEREDLSESLRADGIRSFYGHRIAVAVEAARASGSRGSGQVKARREATLSDADASFLRGLYGRTGSRAIKGAVLETVARAGGSANDAWLMEIVRNQNEDLRYRTAALSRLRRSDVAVAELASLYDALTERDLRASIISALGGREEPAATDKLIEIARSGTDPSLRRQAISALARKNDPRTTKLLLELVEP
ncbi:MAG TPA: HEAT repeat domain-containing protein [Gemmatimonadales bacterium]